MWNLTMDLEFSVPTLITLKSGLLNFEWALKRLYVRNRERYINLQRLARQHLQLENSGSSQVSSLAQHQRKSNRAELLALRKHADPTSRCAHARNSFLQSPKYTPWGSRFRLLGWPPAGPAEARVVAFVSCFQTSGVAVMA